MVPAAVASVVGGFELGGRDVAEFAVESVVIEPLDPGECGELDVVDVSPRSLTADQLGLVEPVHRLDEGVVIRQSPMLPIGGTAPISASRSL